MEHSAERAVTTIAKSPAVRRAVAAAAPIVSKVAKGTIVLLVALASYYGTTWILQQVDKIGNRATLADWNLTTTMALITARRAAETQLGRVLTIAEKQELKAQFDAQYQKNLTRWANQAGKLGALATAARFLHLS